MGEHAEQQVTRARAARKRQSKQTPDTMGRRLMEIIIYDKHCRIGETLTLDDLAETEIGDWTMPNFQGACTYAASQGWVTVQDNAVTLTRAGLRAG